MGKVSKNNKYPNKLYRDSKKFSSSIKSVQNGKFFKQATNFVLRVAKYFKFRVQNVHNHIAHHTYAEKAKRLKDFTCYP